MTGYILVAIVAGYLLIPVGQEKFSQAVLQQIRVGMTLKEAESLLGPNYSLYDPELGDGAGSATWYDDEANQLILGLDSERRVTGKTVRPSRFSLYEQISNRMVRRIVALRP